MITAVVNTPIDQGPLQLVRSQPENVTRIQVTHGNWVVFGKVILQNLDGADQNSTVILFVGSNGHILDQSNARLPGNGVASSFSMQGSFTVTGDIEHFLISCATHNGQAQQVQITAISVDTLNQSKR